MSEEENIILIKCQRNNSISDCVENRILDNEDQDNIIFDMIDTYGTKNSPYLEFENV